jgi:DNA-binding IscR family transcriptional regulator
LTAVDRRIIAFLADKGSAKGAVIAKALDNAFEYVRARLSHLKKAGLLQGGRDSQAGYSLTKAGRDLLPM